jgi:CheY-like chemotaxis protein
VTDQRTAEHALRDREEQLRHAQKMEAIGQLAGGLAHDFSNTLASISGFASLLRDDTAADDPRRGDIDGILRATQRASSITRRLLTISKKQVQERATLDLRDVLQEFGTLVRPVLPTSIEYSLDVPERPAYATIDRMQIEQALLNLALNARDAMPKGGALSIVLDVVSRGLEGSAASEFARISVRDTGTGIRPEVLARLWEPFFTTKSRGSGLGLPMSRAILREHGGDLQADERANAGAAFTMLLPLASTGVVAARDTVTPGISLAGAPTGLTVLLADDEEAVRVTSKRLLERAGYTVLVASQGGDALRLFLANIGAVDIIVTDLMMPELTGRELVRRVRSNIPDMPVVVTSAYPPTTLPEWERRPSTRSYTRRS